MKTPSLEIDFNDSAKLSFLNITASAVEQVFRYVLASQHILAPCQVSLSIVSDEEIRKLNREWRGVDAPTDVISIECERPNDADVKKGEIVCLGDIFLSPAYIEKQAASFNSSIENETILLLVHAMLHLLGYNHIADDEAKEMETLEDRLVEELNKKL